MRNAYLLLTLLPLLFASLGHANGDELFRNIAASKSKRVAAWMADWWNAQSVNSKFPNHDDMPLVAAVKKLLYKQPNAAMRARELRTIQVLLEGGAHPNAKPDSGQSAFEVFVNGCAALGGGSDSNDRVSAIVQDASMEAALWLFFQAGATGVPGWYPERDELLEEFEALLKVTGGNIARQSMPESAPSSVAGLFGAPAARRQLTTIEEARDRRIKHSEALFAAADNLDAAAVDSLLAKGASANFLGSPSSRENSRDELDSLLFTEVRPLGVHYLPLPWAVLRCGARSEKRNHDNCLATIKAFLAHKVPVRQPMFPDDNTPARLGELLYNGGFDWVPKDPAQLALVNKLGEKVNQLSALDWMVFNFAFFLNTKEKLNRAATWVPLSTSINMKVLKLLLEYSDDLPADDLARLDVLALSIDEGRRNGYEETRQELLWALSQMGTRMHPNTALFKEFQNLHRAIKPKINEWAREQSIEQKVGDKAAKPKRLIVPLAEARKMWSDFEKEEQRKADLKLQQELREAKLKQQRAFRERMKSHMQKLAARSSAKPKPAASSAKERKPHFNAGSPGSRSENSRLGKFTGVRRPLTSSGSTRSITSSRQKSSRTPGGTRTQETGGSTQ